jgi:hypothetical protein
MIGTSRPFGMLTGLQRSASRARPAARPRRRGGGRLRALHLLCLLLGLLLPTSARADTWGQYLVIIDDSGSMDQNDPRRLVVMAAAAIAGGLEESDQIALIGLNELAAGDTPRFVAPSELLPGRDGPEASLALTSDRLTRLTVHRGNTPCSAALERARAFLDANASAGAPQTLLLLTDGACNGGAVLPAERWLAGLRAHQEGRFRFVLLTHDGRERLDAELVRYGALTGWSGDNRISFDARSLLRAFAEVISFSRGLRLDGGGRPGLERTFAGARRVRVLAIAEAGADRIALVRQQAGAAAPIVGSPTFRSPDHGWSLRAAVESPRAAPYAASAATPGVDVLVLPSYGELVVEGVIAPCGAPPPLPWTQERPVRAGQPACAWARLVGDARETITPGDSFAFDLELCEDPACARASAMQPGADGTFNAQLGPAPEGGRHERTFRARGGALARPVLTRRGFAAMSFGIQALTRAGDPTPLHELDLGDLPKSTRESLSLSGRGAFPAGATADLSCLIEGDAAVRDCLTCAPQSPTLELQDPLSIQLDVGAAAFCPAVSEHGGQPLPVRMTLQVTPTGPAAAALSPYTLPIRGLLRYAALTPQRLEIQGGDERVLTVQVPSPVAGAVVIEPLTDGLSADLELQPVAASTRLQAPLGGAAPIELRVLAGECCEARTYSAALLLRAEAGGPALRVPLEIVVSAPSFWVCPGRKILRWGLGALAFLALIWLIRGFISPAKFTPGIVLAYAETHNALGKLREGDEGWLTIDRFAETKRGFYRPAALHLGGAKAPLPSLRRMSPTARAEARPGGGLVLIVSGGDTEQFSESRGWLPLEPGEHPVNARLILRREGNLYLMIRR